MIAGAVMMALPGALMTVALVAVLSVFQEKILSVVNMISIGVSGAVVQAAVRGMSEQDVDATHLVRLQPEFACPAAHGRLGVLVGIFFPSDHQ